MKVWIVNPFDNLPQEGTRPQRYWLMARAFARAGDEVVYWSADFSHAHKCPRVFTTEVNDDFELKLVHEPAYPKNICLKRIYAHWRFARNWLTAALKGTGPSQSKNRKIEESKNALMGTDPSPDVLIVSSPPLSLVAAARRFCRRTGAKLIIDIQDAWPETFYRVLPAWTLWPLKRLARRNYLAADAITAVSRQYIDLVCTYGTSCPTHLCYHGIEMTEGGQTPCKGGQTPSERGQTPGERGQGERGQTPGERGQSPSSRKIEESKNRKIFRLSYVGNMSLSYDLATVIDAVKAVEGVELDLAGTGPDEPALRARAADCPRIRFHGYLAEAELRELLASADAGVVPMFPESCVGIPGKLADYAAAGLPIVNSLVGETAEILADSGAGVNYEAGNADALESVISQWREFKISSSPHWEVLRQSASCLAAEFDATRLYNVYRDFIISKKGN